jgi:hypothetical protein
LFPSALDLDLLGQADGPPFELRVSFSRACAMSKAMGILLRASS